MSSSVAILGAGGHAKVVLDALLTAGSTVWGLVDDDPSLRHTRVGDYLVRGGPEDLNDEVTSVAFGVGDNAARERLARLVTIPASPVVHPAAIVAASARIDEGAVILAGAVVQTEASIGAGAIVNTAAVVEHDCMVGNFAHIAPNSTVAGGAHIGSRSLIGAGAVVLPGVRIGRDVIVGAGAVVISDVPNGATVVGVPARPLGGDTT